MKVFQSSNIGFDKLWKIEPAIVPQEGMSGGVSELVVDVAEKDEGGGQVVRPVDEGENGDQQLFGKIIHT